MEGRFLVRIGMGHDDGAIGCCLARRERLEGRFLVRRVGWGGVGMRGGISG